MKRHHLFFICITILILSIATYVFLGISIALATGPSLYWRSSSIGLPSDIQSLAAAPGPTLYAGTWSDGIYRSDDHGQTWITATLGLALPMYIRDGLAVDPISPTILYAGDYYGSTSGGGVYLSENGGLSWTLSLADTDVETLLVHPLTHTIVLAGSREHGLYRSADGGQSWGSTNLPAQRVQTLAAAAAPADLLYAGAGTDLYVSASAGITWTLASSQSSTVEALALDPITPTMIKAGTRLDGLWRSSDGGLTWITQTAGLPEDAWVTSLAIHPITSTILYAGVWSGQVYLSQNGGATWEGLGYLGTVEAVLIHPTAPSVIYAGTANNGLFRGSMLDHLTIEPVVSPQHVRQPFEIALTARDALGFPLTGLNPQALAALPDLQLARTLAAGGYNGMAALVDSTGTLTPTQVALVNGLAVVPVTVNHEAVGVTITATLPEGVAATSNPFDVIWAARLLLPLVWK